MHDWSLSRVVRQLWSYKGHVTIVKSLYLLYIQDNLNNKGANEISSRCSSTDHGFWTVDAKSGSENILLAQSSYLMYVIHCTFWKALLQKMPLGTISHSKCCFRRLPFGIILVRAYFHKRMSGISQWCDIELWQVGPMTLPSRVRSTLSGNDYI